VSGDLVTSTSNPHLKRARKLRQRKYRDKQGAFFVEGIQPVTQALKHAPDDIESVLVAPGVLGNHPVRDLVDQQRARGTEIVEIEAEAFASISNRDDPSGLAAIVKTMPTELEELEVEPDSLFVALDEVGNPGNLGAIIRTLDAVRGDAVVLMGAATDPYHPTAVKASMGTIFALPVCRVAGFEELRTWATIKGVSLITTSAKATTEHWTTHFPLPAVIVLGSEGRGLSPDVLDAGDLKVRIPIEGSASSLNLAIAASVLFYEVQRQRRTDL
jgi:RNA methyltransferase, TrmH family